MYPNESDILPTGYVVIVAPKVTTIKMFVEDTQNTELNPEYIKYSTLSRVVPNTINIQNKTVDVCESKHKLRKIKVFVKGDSRKLSPRFTKAYREGLVLTPMFDVFKQHTPSSTSKRKGKVVKDKGKIAGFVAELKTRMKDLNELTRGNREVHPITVRFKMFHTDPNKKKREYWETYKSTFSYPVLKAFHKFSTSVQKDEAVYTFFKENEDFDQVKDPYKSLLNFLEYIDYIDATNNRKSLNNLSEKKGSSRSKLHTPEVDQRQRLTDFVEQIDKYAHVNSNNLIEMRLTSDVPISEFVTTPGGLADSILADRSSTYINSEYFVGTPLRIENDKIIRTDCEYEQFFESFVGIKYRKNSCLATCALHHMYISEDKSPNRGKVKWWNDAPYKIGSKFPPPTYDTISSLCGIPFGDDGSLRLSLNQIKPFLQQYSMRCYGITPRNTLVFKFIPTDEKKCMTKPFGVTGLKLIISHEHVNLIPQNFAKKFSDDFKDAEAVSSESSKELLHEYYQPPPTTGRGGECCFARYPIRTNFDNPKGSSIDREFMKIEADAQKMVDVLLKMAHTEQNAKVKTPRMCSTYYYVGDFVRIAIELKTKHNILVCDLILGGRAGDQIKTFSIVYISKDVNVRLIVGNNFCENITETDAEYSSQLIQTHDDLENYYREYQLLYKKLFNKRNMSTYSDSFKHELTTYTCSPISFCEIHPGEEDYDGNRICAGGIDSNKSYTSNMLACDKLPLFSHFADMELLDRPITITNKNVNQLSDFAIYKVHTDRVKEHDVARYIIFDKSVCLYYGKYLKEVIEIIPHAKFQVVEKIEAFKTIAIDWSSDLQRLYSKDNRLSETQKKLIPNAVLGCLDKAKTSHIMGDCFYSKKDADQVFNCHEGVSRLELASHRSDKSWDDCIKLVEGELIGELSSWDKQIRVNTMFQKCKPTLHVNVIRKSTSEFNQGFLPLSLMKYNHSRLTVLRMWVRAAESGSVIPIGVKTDCVFVARYNFENYVRFSSRLLKPNAEWDERLRAEDEAVREENATVEAAKAQAWEDYYQKHPNPEHVYRSVDSHKAAYEEQLDVSRRKYQECVEKQNKTI